MNALEIMLAELESNRLEVQLVPLRRYVNEGGMRRVAVSKNATWYRAFCANHASTRKRKNALFDTCIKRRNIVSVLGHLIDRGTSRSVYADELQRIAARFAKGVAA